MLLVVFNFYQIIRNLRVLKYFVSYGIGNNSGDATQYRPFAEL